QRPRGDEQLAELVAVVRWFDRAEGAGARPGALTRGVDDVTDHVADGDLDRTEAFARGIHDRGDLVGLGHVRGDGVHAARGEALDVLGRRIEVRLGAGGDDHAGAFTGERLGDGAPDATAAAGNDR